LQSLDKGSGSDSRHCVIAFKPNGAAKISGQHAARGSAMGHLSPINGLGEAKFEIVTIEIANCYDY
jgi:hypothetical protein